MQCCPWAELDEVTQAIAGKNARKKLMEQLIRIIKEQEPLTKFDVWLWASLVDFVTVYSKKGGV